MDLSWFDEEEEYSEEKFLQSTDEEDDIEEELESLFIGEGYDHLKKIIINEKELEYIDEGALDEKTFDSISEEEEEEAESNKAVKKVISPPPGFDHVKPRPNFLSQFKKPDKFNTTFQKRFDLFPSNSFKKIGFNRGEYMRLPYDKDWKKSKINANHLKYCPGETCKVHLPLYYFATNTNMIDNLDIYCVNCNLRKKNERIEKRNKLNHIDKFELFNNHYNKKTPESEDRYIMREVLKIINQTIIETEKRFNKKISVDALEIARQMFHKKKIICNVTYKPLTPKCFLNHHIVTLELRNECIEVNNKKKRIMDIICSDCELSLNV